MKQTQKFTLIEILTVIAIIGILAAIIYPALMAVQNNSRRTKTETILTGVTTAIKVYKGDNYLLPRVGGSVKEQIGFWSGKLANMEPDNDYYTFFDILTYKDHSNGANEPSSTVKAANPKAKQYLDPPKEYFGDRNTNSIRDAWSRPIVVFLDHDSDGSVDVPGGTYGKKETTYGGDSVAISLGNQDCENASQADKDAYILIK